MSTRGKSSSTSAPFRGAPSGGRARPASRPPPSQGRGGAPPPRGAKAPEPRGAKAPEPRGGVRPTLPPHRGGRDAAPPGPTALRDLLGEAQRLAAEGAGQDEIVARVYAVAEQYGIRVRHDEYEPHRAPLAGAPLAGAAPPPPAPGAEEAPGRASQARGAKKAAGARPGNPVVTRQPDGSHRLSLAHVFDPDFDSDFAAGQAPPAQGATVGRLVLSGDKRGGGAARGRAVPLYYECNGLVLDARTWRALAVPPSAFNPRPAAKDVDAHLGEGLYDVIRVDDGTVVTLYSWQHPTDGLVWALASSNGYDVSSLYWIGPLTYAEVFYDIVLRLYPAFGEAAGISLHKEGGTTRLGFTALDPSRCYTVGFRHHNFHPLVADPERMWQIQSADLAGAVPQVLYSGGLPGVPEQAVYHDLRALGFGEEDAAAPTLEGLRALGRDALDRATAYVAERAAAPAGPPPAVLPAELHYGFILRSRDVARTGECSDVLAESPLLARVRKTVYERAPRSVRDELTAADRLEYNAMRAYLTAHERAGFLALYPEWAPRFRTYQEFVDNISRLVIHSLRQRAMAPTSREPALRSVTGQVAGALLDHINRHERLSAFHRDVDSIVHDYVVNPEYAFLFLRALHSGAGASETIPGGVAK